MADTLESLELQIKHNATGADSEINKVTDSIRALSRTLTTVLPKLQVFRDLMGEKSVVFNDNSTKQYASTINNVHQAAVKASAATKDVAKNVDEAAKSAKKAQSPLSNFVSSLKRIAFYRFIRTVIKSISQAFSEGLKNAYLFSAGLTSTGHRFAEAMDTMNSKSTQLKSQLGSAFISLLTALEPVITQILVLIIKLADAVSQLFAAFTGTTYLRAAEVTDTLVDDFKSGSKAAKEWKNQLLGFDVINRLNDNNSGGLTPSQLFGGKEAPIDEKYIEIANFIKKLIPDMETLKALAKEIALLFLAWKIGSMFGKDLQQIVGLALLLYSTFKFVGDYIRTLDEGLSWDNLVKLLGDILGMAIGAYLAFGKIGAGIALVVGGAALIVAAFKDMKENGMNLINTLTMIAGLLTAGLGISILTKSWIPLAIAAIASLVLALVYAFGEGENFTQGMTKIFSGLGQFFKGIFAGDIKAAMKGVQLAWEGAKQVGQSVVNALKKAWQSLLTWIENNLGPKWRAFFEDAGRAVSNFVSNNIRGLTGLVEFISGIFTRDWDKAWQGVKDILAGVANHMLNIVGFFVNGFIDGVNGLIDGMNLISGKVPDWLEFANLVVPGLGSLLVSANDLKLNRIAKWTPPQFAEGGFPEAGLFVARESGPEMVGTIGNRTAVANNDQIVEAVSSGVANAVSAVIGNGKNATEVHVYLDSREIKAGQSRLARAVGG